MKQKQQRELTEIEQRAEDIVRAMVSESWNESVETIANLLRELEATRKVADAAAAGQITRNAHIRLRALEWQDYDARCEISIAIDEAQVALDDAVSEYRRRHEPLPSVEAWAE